MSHLNAGTCVQIVARNEAGDWFLMPQGIWIAAEDVAGAPDTSAIAVAIPTPTPTMTRTPTITPTPTVTPAPTSTPVPTSTPIPTMTPLPSPTATPLPTPMYTIGTDVMVANVRWHIFSAENLGNTLTSDDSYRDPLTTSGKFIRIRFEMENRSSSLLSYGGFNLVDSQGREFVTSSRAIGYIPNEEDCSIIENLNPNVPKVCMEIFEVAVDATGLKAKLGDLELFGSAEALVDLGL